MDEITIGDKTYISSKQAAKITGYAKDYVGQLCREGRVEARLVGRNWYVLDSAIREHRFGKEEPVPAPKESEATLDRVSTWQKPQYAAEMPVSVPSLTQKPLETVGTPAIADMQSAWREWFEEKQQPLAALPDGSEDFKDEHLPLIVPEEAPVEDSKPIEAPAEITEHADQNEETVVISRFGHQPEPEITFRKENELEAGEKVELHRSYTSINTARKEYRNEIVADLPTAHTPVSIPQPVKTKSNLGNGVARAVLVVISLLAVLTAVVGTGNADQLLSGTSLDFGAQKEIVDFLGGKSTYESSL